MICLGFGGRDLDEIADEVLRVQKPDEYSAEWLVQQFKGHFCDLADNDLDNMMFCRERRLRYYDVFGRHDEICREVLDVVGDWVGCVRHWKVGN